MSIGVFPCIKDSVYIDDGVSGTTFDRPEFNRLVQDATDKKINLVLCKDPSRLGRDYIETGRYTDFVFPSLGCRFIALNDGVDTLQKNNEMLVIIKNVMNDLYARDTSSKIKAVKQSTFKSGKYVGCYAPLGYKKSESDKHVLEIDPITAPVVKHIFDMRLQGDSFRKIATQLNAEGVPASRTFYYMATGRENIRSKSPYWNDTTVKTILRNEVYLGHMVQNKTGTVSYKNHKQVDKPQSEWIKVENTHEPIISQDVWDAVQRMDNHPGRGRTGKSGMIALFGGILRCMDCGSSLRYMRDYRKTTSGKEPEFKSYVCNRYATPNWQLIKHQELNKRLTELTEDLEELRSEKARLLAEFSCSQEDISTAVKSVKSQESRLAELENMEKKYLDEFEALKGEYAELKGDVPAEALSEIQKVSGQKATEKIRSAYRDRTDYSLIEQCRNEVDSALGEKREKESVIDRLAKAKPMHRDVFCVLSDLWRLSACHHKESRLLSECQAPPAKRAALFFLTRLGQARHIFSRAQIRSSHFPESIYLFEIYKNMKHFLLLKSQRFPPQTNSLKISLGFFFKIPIPAVPMETAVSITIHAAQTRNISFVISTLTPTTVCSDCKRVQSRDHFHFLLPFPETEDR